MATLIVVEDLAVSATRGRGGHAMYLLQWLRGLERLGHHVVYLEFLDTANVADEVAAACYFRDTIEARWHRDQAALVSLPSMRSLYGLDVDRIRRVADKAEAVIDLAANYRREPWPLLEHVRPRVLVENDPGYTHLWAAEGDPVDIFGQHDLYFTVGGNIGTARCAIPTVGIDWHHVWNPVVLDWWPTTEAPTRSRFTTIADWRGYGYLEFAGQLLGPKAVEFWKFIELPRLIDGECELVLDTDPDDPDLVELRDRGWHVKSPAVVSTPTAYRDYVSGSSAEFSCAKGGYVGTRGGWFSDRSACYLAVGRPVVLQATGFEDLLPTGRGLFAVRSAEEAAEAIRAIQRDYAVHSAAARALAVDYFDSDQVLSRLIAEIGVGIGAS